MKIKKIFLIFLGITILLSAMVIFKPALAMAPPPASRIWLWWWLTHQNGPGQMVTVTVKWKEGARTETVELKTRLKDTR